MGHIIERAYALYGTLVSERNRVYPVAQAAEPTKLLEVAEAGGGQGEVARWKVPVQAWSTSYDLRARRRKIDLSCAPVMRRSPDANMGTQQVLALVRGHSRHDGRNQQQQWGSLVGAALSGVEASKTAATVLPQLIVHAPPEAVVDREAASLPAHVSVKEHGVVLAPHGYCSSYIKDISGPAGATLIIGMLAYFAVCMCADGLLGMDGLYNVTT